MNRFFVVIVGLSISFSICAQSVIKGTVFDENNDRIPFANIAIVDSNMQATGIGASTDFDGNYIISNLDNGNYDVKVAYLGYNSILKKDVVLAEDTLVLDFNIKPSEDVILECVMVAYRMDGFLAGKKNSVRNMNKDMDYLPKRDKVENKRLGFVETSIENTSTFSIDVDNASYTQIRKEILDYGDLPDTSTVRTEEMINYFNYHYTYDQDDNTPFSIHTELSDCVWNESTHLLQIGLQGQQPILEDLPISNLSFLIDVSGSMGDDLELVKESLKLLIDNLSTDDIVSIVVYAGSAGEVLPPTPVIEKQKIYTAIDDMQAGGSTAGGEGIELAYKLTKENFIEDGNNRIIMCTDGDFNVGVSSDKDLVSMVKEKRDEDIFLTICGFGYGNYRDTKMEQLADNGNGNYYYIDNIREARKVFVHGMHGTLLTIAKDVKIQVEFDENIVESYKLIGYENRKMDNEDFGNDKKDAGELGAGHQVTAFYEIILNQDAVTTDLSLGKLNLRYKEPNKKKSILVSNKMTNSIVELQNASPDFKLAASVAAFGLLFSDKENNHVSHERIIELAQASLIEENDLVEEFIEMVYEHERLVSE